MAARYHWTSEADRIALAFFQDLIPSIRLPSCEPNYDGTMKLERNGSDRAASASRRIVN